jgi:hypothetical protein
VALSSVLFVLTALYWMYSGALLSGVAVAGKYSSLADVAAVFKSLCDVGRGC